MIGTFHKYPKTQLEVSIFKTSIATEKDIAIVRSLIDRIVGKNRWNFDLEDRDNILRINANTAIHNFLTQEMGKLGFECKELH